jgi:hypothetical protein
MGYQSGESFSSICKKVFTEVEKVLTLSKASQSEPKTESESEIKPKSEIERVETEQLNKLWNMN